MAQEQHSAVARSRGVKRVGYWEDVAPDFATALSELDGSLFERLDGTVKSGPFMGMKLIRSGSWKDSRLSPMLLGCYEEELHGILHFHFDRLRDLAEPKIAVIGCADGYYAVGMKMRLPRARVFAVDSDALALKITQEAARANGVEVEVGKDLTEVLACPDLIVADCEGAEVAYLDRDAFPSVTGAHVIVEIHNYSYQKTDQILLERFRGSHKIDMLREGPRDPNRFEELHDMTSDYRWMAVSEGRPAFMCWYHMVPRGLAIA